MSPVSRRQFLVASSIAAAGGAASATFASPMWALPARGKLPVSAYLPDVVDPATLRSLAQTAMDAAKSAGAEYADIRVANRRMMEQRFDSSYDIANGAIGFDYSFGVRVRVGNGWAFAYGSDPSPDHIAATVRTAVSTARGVAKTVRTRFDFTPAPAVTGEWAATVAIDPFSVSPDEHSVAFGAFKNATKRASLINLSGASRWVAETRVFASTHGTLITQRMMNAMPAISLMASSRGFVEPTVLPLTKMATGTAGFEIMLGEKLQDHVRERAEEARRLTDIEQGLIDVGRFDILCDGFSTARLAGATVLPALDLERVLGFEIDGVGSSYMSPMAEILGKQMFSPRFTFGTDRREPHMGAAKWDDEGSATEPFNVIEKGKVVDYFASLRTVSALASWRQSQGKTQSTYGSGIAWSPTRTPHGTAYNVTVAPGTETATMEDLQKQLGTGLLIRSLNIQTDAMLSGGMSGWKTAIFEVKKGQVTRRMKGGALQIASKLLWKNLKTVGDGTTLESFTRNTTGGQPWVVSSQGVTAPACIFTDVNLVRSARYGL